MICNICGKSISEKNFKEHYKRCSEILSHIDKIIELYHTSTPSIDSLCKMYKCDYNRLKNIMSIYKKDCFHKEDRVNHSFLKEQNKFKYWFAGIMASDGCISDKNNVISIAQSGKDGLKIIKYISTLIGFNGEIYKRKTSKKPNYAIYFSSKEMKEDFYKYNIVPQKIYVYEYPTEYIKTNMLKYFLLGYIEGDGSITIQNNGKNCFYLNVSFVGTESFVKTMIKELSSIDSKFIFKIRKCSKSCVYEAYCTGKKAQYFCKWLFSDEDMYKSYKYYNYEKSLSQTRQTYSKREDLKEEIMKFINENSKYLYIKEIAKKYGVAFQTIYTWRNEKYKIRSDDSVDN